MAGPGSRVAGTATKGGAEIATYATDESGTLLSVSGAGAATYAYDPFGRLASAESASGRVTYAYDALDRTVSRTQGAALTTYAYTGSSHEIAAETTGGAATTYANAPSGPLAQSVDGAVSYLLRDPHTDVVGTVSASGSLTSAVSYDPFGQVAGSAGTPPRLGFQGDPTDPATGLVDMQTRLYAPSLGRFTTRDVLFGDPAQPLTLNQFAYTSGNPLTFLDPTGMYRTQGGGCTSSCNESYRKRSKIGGPAPVDPAITVYDPEPRIPGPPSLNLKVEDFEAMSARQRIQWLQAFDTHYATQYRAEGWFDAIEGILQFANRRDYFEESPWFSTVDATILHSLMRGMAFARGDINSAGPAAMQWAAFFQYRAGSARPGYFSSRALWSRAETEATERGLRRANALGFGPTRVDIEIYIDSTAWRAELLAPDFLDGPDSPLSAFFDPRVSRHAFEGADLLYRAYAGY